MDSFVWFQNRAVIAPHVLLVARLLAVVFVVALVIVLFSGSRDERATAGAAVVTFAAGLATLGGRK